MPLRNETQTRLTAEIAIVPPWAWMLAVVAFAAAQWYFNIAVARNSGAPPAWVRVVLGVMAGIGSGGYLLIIGYISRDAKRRGMSRVLWTLEAVLIPNGLGIILYFILRQPRSSACPQRGNAVQTGFNFCPGCNYKLSPSCPQCQRLVGVNDVYCPYCGTSQRNQVVPAPSSAMELPG